MSITTETSLRCPTCAKHATATLEWSDRDGTVHCEVRDYRCSAGCTVDRQTVREVIGAP
ncbi:MAG TPA: hypothetical protein VE442_17895 [Jatrophihabitans sp.]|jgi:hypothetical protein|nr:hypothetical protein [Jatrophihabitans sp.]